MSAPVDFGEVVAALQSRVLDVAQSYAPGGHVEGQRYWALNPARGDRRIGSFHVALSGAYAGRWRDEATGEGGDMLDLIQAALGLDRKGAFEEAKRYLGLGDETPAQAELRKRQAARAAERRRADVERARTDLARKSAAAHALFLRCQTRLGDSPAGEYLKARGIGINRLGRVPNALRFHPALPYSHVDPDTGEIFEGEYPALVAAIHGPSVEGGQPAFWGVHRTWLAREPSGRWWKAPVPAPKKVMGRKKGGFIRLWAGFGPRGGKGSALSKAGPGTRVFITEGIEDGLSVAVLKPEARVLVAIDLGNVREMVLPPSVGDVTIVRDNDADPRLRALVDRARERFLSQGRAVREWSNHYGGKDLNDALMTAGDAEGVA